MFKSMAKWAVIGVWIFTFGYGNSQDIQTPTSTMGITEVSANAPTTDTPTQIATATWTFSETVSPTSTYTFTISTATSTNTTTIPTYTPTYEIPATATYTISPTLFSPTKSPTPSSIDNRLNDMPSRYASALLDVECAPLTQFSVDGLNDCQNVSSSVVVGPLGVGSYVVKVISGCIDSGNQPNGQDFGTLLHVYAGTDLLMNGAVDLGLVGRGGWFDDHEVDMYFSCDAASMDAPNYPLSITVSEDHPYIGVWTADAGGVYCSDNQYSVLVELAACNATPVGTQTPVESITPTITTTNTKTHTATHTPTETPTLTYTVTFTPTATETGSVTGTITPPVTETVSITPSPVACSVEVSSVSLCSGTTANISSTLSGTSGSGRFILRIVGSQTYVVKDETRAAGSYVDEFDIGVLSSNSTFSQVEATWEVEGQSCTGTRSCSFDTLSDYTITRYNTPDENEFNGRFVNINVSSGPPGCAYDSVSARSDFVQAVVQNGSGRLSNGSKIQIEWICASSAVGRNFRYISQINGSCNTTLTVEQSVATDPSLLSCNEQLCIDGLVGQKVVADIGRNIQGTRIDLYLGIGNTAQCVAEGRTQARVARVGTCD